MTSSRREIDYDTQQSLSLLMQSELSSGYQIKLATHRISEYQKNPAPSDHKMIGKSSSMQTTQSQQTTQLHGIGTDLSTFIPLADEYIPCKSHRLAQFFQVPHDSHDSHDSHDAHDAHDVQKSQKSQFSRSSNVTSIPDHEQEQVAEAIRRSIIERELKDKQDIAEQYIKKFHTELDEFKSKISLLPREHIASIDLEMLKIIDRKNQGIIKSVEESIISLYQYIANFH
jgi:hypothetical protein